MDRRFCDGRTPEVSMWVMVPKLSMQYWRNDTLSKLASQLRHPVEIDMVTKLKDQPNFARVKIRMAVGISI